VTGSGSEVPAADLPDGAVGVARVITVSTSAAAGAAADRSGPLLVEGLRGMGLLTDDPVVVADGDPVGDAPARCLAEGVDVVLLTGGTGLTADDSTPEQVLPHLDRVVPGISEALRADGRARGVPTAALSRGVAGVAGRTLVVALPGSTGACRDALEVLAPLLPHAVAMLRAATQASPADVGHAHGRGL
jgi:molybdenum cofactor synthesis domain-containing protein